MTFTVVPFVIAFMAALLTMPALDIYQVNAWNVGTAKLEAWRARTSASIHRTMSAARVWIDACRSRLTLPHLGLAAAGVALTFVVMHQPAHAGVLLAAVVLGTPAEMRDRRAKLLVDAGALNAGGETGFSFKTPEDRTKFDDIMKDVDAYGVALEDADRGARHAQLSRTTLPESQRQTPPTSDDQREAMVKYERALGLYLRGMNMSDMAPEERQVLQSGYRVFTDAEKRDMSTFSGANGGFVVAPDTRFYNTIVQAVKFYGSIEAAGAEVIETDTAGELPIPMGDDTGNVGTIIPEARVSGHAGGTSPTLTDLVLHGYLYSSKVIKVSWQLLRDSAVDIETYVGGLLGERLARAQNQHFITGTGSGQPQGVITVATVGRQAVTGNTTSIPFDDIYRTVHSVDVAYRTPKAKWMMHDTTALALRLAKDAMGRYLWPEMGSVQNGQPAQLAGYGVTINNWMATPAASAKTMSFGDHSYYKIRRIRGITIVRINELYVESGQVGFLAFQSADGGFADAGQHPVKLFQQSAS